MKELRVLRPLTNGEIFNEAFDLYKRNFALFAGIGAMVFLPCALLSALASNAPLLKGLIALAVSISSVAVEGAIIKALADRYLGRDVTIAGAWRYLGRRLLPYVFTSMRVGLMIGLGLLFFVIPGIVTAILLFFVPCVMMVEDRYYRAATSRGRELAAGQTGRIVVVGLLTLVLAISAFLVAGLIAAGVESLLSLDSGTPASGPVPLASALLEEILQAGVQTVLTPITSLLAVLLYFDVRVRKEGFDIELLAQEMGEPPLGGGPSIAPA